MKRKLLSVSVLLTAILLSAPSCGNTTATAEPTPVGETEAVTEKLTETAVSYADQLPEGLDFGGQSVRFLYREEISDEFYTDTDTADIVNDALNASIRAVEERLNTDIVLIPKAGHILDAREGYMNDIVNSVLAGDDAYDWVDLMIGNSPLQAQKGIFSDLSQMNYLDFSQPWYIPNLADTVSFGGRLYFTSGDASLGYLKCAYCMYFNKAVAERYDLTDIYQTVSDGKWTVERLMEYSALTSQDINNDGKYTLDDQLGFVLHDQNHAKGFIRSCDVTVFSKDSDGAWRFDFGSERDESVITKLSDMRNGTGTYFYSGTNAVRDNLDDYNAIASLFTGGSVFIISAEMDDAVDQFRNMKDSYGILPFPKYDETQKEYYTISRNTHNAFSMPVTCKNSDMACAVLEALGSSNYTSVTPTYFETAMKTKYATSPEDGAMFDLIHNSMVLDFGYIYSNAITGVYDTVKDMIGKNNKFASKIASMEKSVTKSLGKYREAIETNCN